MLFWYIVDHLSSSLVLSSLDWVVLDKENFKNFLILMKWVIGIDFLPKVCVLKDIL